MTREHANAIRLAADFKQRGPTDRIDLMNLMVMEGNASLVASGPSGWLGLDMYGVNASGGTPWELIDNWCAMVKRHDEIEDDGFITVYPPRSADGRA